MPKLDAAEVARLLAEYGRRSALRGGNPYGVKAYVKAAENLRALPEPLDRIVDEGRLQDIPGIGDAIADIVTKLHKTGSHPSLEKLREESPPGLLDMLAIPGLRPEKARKIHEALGIDSVAELERAARDGRLARIKGLGPAFQRKVLQGLELQRSTQGARHIHRAAELLRAAERNLANSTLDLQKIEVSGDFRRSTELVKNLAVVAQAAHLKDGPKIIRNADLSVHLTDRKRFGITQLLATGSQSHLDHLRKLATKHDMKLTSEGLMRGNTVVAAQSERGIYKALGLPFIEPELREGRDELKWAATGSLPKLVREADIRGILHAHTDRSDGINTLDEMAKATEQRGYEYFGVADHSQSAHYAGGLKAAEVEDQQREADLLNRSWKGKFRILKGIESDILPDGALDYPDEVLAGFDFVVASVHGQFRKDKKAQTERILRAAANPYVTILGHMTGRQLLRRPGYEIDIEAVLSACAEHGVAVEINANPWRLDLDWRFHQKALELGCMMSINPDAHSTSELDLIRWGVQMARKGGVPARRVLNAMSLRELEAWLKKRRRHTKHAKAA